MAAQEDKIIVNCDSCGKELKLTKRQYERSQHHFCSQNCSNEYKKRNQVECICAICGTSFSRKKSQIDKMKDSKNVTCSKKCCYELRKILYKNEGNPQYGLTGNKNSSWKSDERYKNYSNKYTLVRAENHPYCDKSNFVPEHRLIAEKYLLTNENSVEINDKRYLKQECVVHHIDFNKKNNSPNNLFVFENESIHTLFHNLVKSNRVKDIEDFFEYYKDNYINKILNYDWLYKAYIEFDLSVNQISDLFNIPYASIQTEINKNNLKQIKKENTHKNELMKLIKKELQNFSKDISNSNKQF